MTTNHLTQAELDHMAPDCGHESSQLYFHSKCHPKMPTWVMYERGILTVSCGVCDKVVARVEVAP